MSWMLLTSWLVSTALAGDCDAQRKALAEAAPATAARHYTALAKCDPGAAKAAAADTFATMIGGSDVPEALVHAIEAGAGDAARAWLERQEPDVRSRAISKVGGMCAEHPAVGAFFVAAYDAKGTGFFVDRWHRGLPECRTEGVRTLLTEALDDAEVGRASRNRTQFYALLEVYARNVGADAIPRLAEFLTEARDEPEAVQLVAVFPDTANVGGSGGTDAEAAKEAVGVLLEAVPELPQKAVGAARTALTSLGDAAAADGIARHYWRDRFDGTYRYGLAITEDITCKNGKKQAVLHHALLFEPGEHWPQQVVPEASDLATSRWKMLAGKCKGTAETLVTMSPEPLTADGYNAWLRTQVESFNERFGAVKRDMVDEGELKL